MIVLLSIADSFVKLAVQLLILRRSELMAWRNYLSWSQLGVSQPKSLLLVRICGVTSSELSPYTIFVANTINRDMYFTLL